MITSVIEHGGDVMDMMPDIRQAHDALHRFLYQNVYSGSAAKTEDHKAQELIRRLYAYYETHPDRMPDVYRMIAERDSVPRAVCDYIAGMSDDYAINDYEKLFIPRSWDVK